MAKLRKKGARSRADRRMEADKLHEDYNKLTPQQKLDRLPINVVNLKKKLKN